MDCIKNNKQGVEILTDYCAGILDPKHCRRNRRPYRAMRGMPRAGGGAAHGVGNAGRLDAAGGVAEFRRPVVRAHRGGADAEPAWRKWLGRVFRPATPYRMWKPAVSLAAAGAVVALALLVLTADRCDGRRPRTTERRGSHEHQRSQIPGQTGGEAPRRSTSNRCSRR